jgi:hypothetical protein
VIILDRLLPDSCWKTHEEQIAMIDELREKTFINYQFPHFKYALAANLLNGLVEDDNKAFWVDHHINRAETRTLEGLPISHTGNSKNTTLTVGNYRPTTGPFFPYMEQVANEFRFRLVGIAPI